MGPADGMGPWLTAGRQQMGWGQRPADGMGTFRSYKKCHGVAVSFYQIGVAVSHIEVEPASHSFNVVLYVIG